jgi:hypothetical protein
MLTRFLLIGTVLLLVSGARIERNGGDMMSPEEMLRRSTHVFIGVIEKHERPNKLRIRVSGEDAGHWMVVKRRVRVENVLRGTESRPVIDVYEVFWAGGLMGDWNSTQDNGRYLFPVRLDNGRYHLTRDFWRSIYPVYSGRHNRLPLDESKPMWERFALMQWWVQPDRSRGFGATTYTDPGRAFGRWRMAKVLRGLFHHPDRDVRLAACEDLLHMSTAQDECWDTLAPKDQQSLNRFWNVVPAQDSWRQNRRFETHARQSWESTMSQAKLSSGDVDELRLLTTINNSQLRREFCMRFQQRFPRDTNNGCPADRSPPATIVTQDGDIPLNGAWPKP